MLHEGHLEAALLHAIPFCLLLAIMSAAIAIATRFTKVARFGTHGCGAAVCLISIVLFAEAPTQIAMPDWLTVGDRLRVALSMRTTPFSCTIICAMSLGLLIIGRIPERQWSTGTALDGEHVDTDVARLGIVTAFAAAVMSILVTDLFAWFLLWCLARLAAGWALWTSGTRGVLRQLGILSGLTDCLICWALLLLWNDVGTMNQWIALEPTVLSVAVIRQPSALSTVTMLLLGLYGSAAVLTGQFPFSMRIFAFQRIPLAGRYLIWGMLAPAGLAVLLRHANVFPAATSTARELIVVLSGWTALLAALNALFTSGWQPTMAYQTLSLLGVVFVGAGLGTERSVTAAGTLLVVLIPLTTGCFLWHRPRTEVSQIPHGPNGPGWVCSIAGVLLFSGCAGQQVIIAESLQSPTAESVLAPMQSRLLSAMLVLQLTLAAAAMTRVLRTNRPAPRDSVQKISWAWTVPLLALVAALLFGWMVNNAAQAAGIWKVVHSVPKLDFNLSGFAPVLGAAVVWVQMSRQVNAQKSATASSLVSNLFHVEQVLGQLARNCGRCISGVVWLCDELALSRFPRAFGSLAGSVVGRMRAPLQNAVYQQDLLGALLALTVFLALFTWLLD